MKTRSQLIATVQSAPGDIFVLTTSNPGKIVEQQRLLSNAATMISSKEFATLLGCDAKVIESPENELDYAKIAEGKVMLVKNKALQIAPEDLRPHLAKMVLVGDDYGADIAAVKFTYDPHFGASGPETAVKMDLDALLHITAVRTNEQALNGQPFPGRFSHRMTTAYAKQCGLAGEPFEPLANELLYQADRAGNRATAANIAISFGRIREDAPVVTCVERQSYQLIPSNTLGQEGFAFDRLQQAQDGSVIGSWNSRRKDEEFPRGAAFRHGLALWRFADRKRAPVGYLDRHGPGSSALILQQALAKSSEKERFSGVSCGTDRLYVRVKQQTDRVHFEKLLARHGIACQASAEAGHQLEISMHHNHFIDRLRVFAQAMQQRGQEASR